MTPKIRFNGQAGHQCGACGAVFSSLNGFDKHRKAFQCRDPYAVGLFPLRTVVYDTNHGEMLFSVFGEPMDDDQKAAAAIRRGPRIDPKGLGNGVAA